MGLSLTSVILPESSQLVEDGAIRQHYLEAKNGAVERAVSEKTEPSGVGGDVPTDLAAERMRS